MKLNNNLNASSIDSLPELFCSENISFGKFAWDEKVYYGIIIFVPVKKVKTNIGIKQTIAP